MDGVVVQHLLQLLHGVVDESGVGNGGEPLYVFCIFHIFKNHQVPIAYGLSDQALANIILCVE